LAVIGRRSHRANATNHDRQPAPCRFRGKKKKRSPAAYFGSARAAAKTSPRCSRSNTRGKLKLDDADHPPLQDRRGAPGHSQIWNPAKKNARGVIVCFGRPAGARRTRNTLGAPRGLLRRDGRPGAAPAESPPVPARNPARVLLRDNTRPIEITVGCRAPSRSQGPRPGLRRLSSRRSVSPYRGRYLESAEPESRDRADAGLS